MKEKLKKIGKKISIVFAVVFNLMGVPLFVLGCLLRAVAWIFVWRWQRVKEELDDIKRFL